MDQMHNKKFTGAEIYQKNFIISNFPNFFLFIFFVYSKKKKTTKIQFFFGSFFVSSLINTPKSLI